MFILKSLRRDCLTWIIVTLVPVFIGPHKYTNTYYACNISMRIIYILIHKLPAIPTIYSPSTTFFAIFENKM